MNRQQRREEMKKPKSVDSDALESKMSLFGKTPNECLTCEKPFNKKDKEMAMTWSVVVHGDEEIVRLYCPDCWSLAEGIAKDFAEHLEEKYGGDEE